MSGWILAIDIGNSRIKVGLFADQPQGEPVCLKQAGFALGDPWYGEDLPWDELRGNASVRGVIAGANPLGIDKVIDGWPRESWGTPRVISLSDDFPLTIEVDAPRQVGIDRLLNAVAVRQYRSADQKAIIVDSGTATTVDLVSVDGSFCGGAILPGFELCARALHQYTALLPLISLDELTVHVPNARGLNTRTALHSGLYWGQVGAVHELVKQLTAEDPTGDVLLVLTGGGAPLLHESLIGQNTLYKPYLALEGLVLVDRATG
ncbi:MAG: type III pantothenate kinase [Planctomycetota bacterium]|nr:type III pantothenate kinase [Planctomycetota bacterium]MDA1211302.1 type III pantothenate kinase [Planctomycetota bacterium]